MICISKDWKDYELLETGDQQKTERWKDIILRRPDPNAYGRILLVVSYFRMVYITVQIQVEEVGLGINLYRKGGKSVIRNLDFLLNLQDLNTQDYFQSRLITGIIL